jgi:hypothetical protein
MLDMGVFMRNKIKNLWKNFKHWLIRKLGGYVAPTQKLEVKHSYYPTVKYYSSITLSDWEKEHRMDIIQKELAEDITKTILNEIELHTSRNLQEGTTTYLAEIEIVKRS